MEYEEICKIESTSENKKYWINKEFISQNIKNKLKDSNLIFIPEKRYGGDIGFHEEALPFFEYIEEKNDENITANFCIDEENYQEFILHSYVIRFGEILVESIILPIAINYLYDYLKTKFSNSSEEDKIEIKLNIEKNNQNIEFEYNGSINNFKEIIRDIDKFIDMVEKVDE